ncbi:uncharacterized protein ATNIH1004_011335 [Aspergillus tanneri]|uniref:PNPLA domain-containing protein n=1 Tax=Aspergillus tanneri TaxID=1220188 RepID=A0A5M9M6L5_9EURO|nr:uncharacterized protein ATNIH1004_011335 [Aspergillus tanneri]KAA8642391.1 hypothetical protein ATNIH1004_011335 [Aspergillus tanneri]
MDNLERDWLKAAQALDDHLGNQAWKEIDEYAYYDHLTINKLVTQLKNVREQVECEHREGHSGSSETSAVEELCTLLEAHLNTNFGRTALCLSGGATFAYYHFGVVKALLDNGVLPQIVTGTSGGALVAAFVATRTDEELRELLVPALAHRITASHEGFPAWFRRWWRTGARFDAVDWARDGSWFCRGSTTFREAYERTGRILNVSCVPSDPHSPTILANYLTSPNCVIWSAMLASAAVPGILNPVVLMTKKRDGTLAPYSFGHKWKDGSLRTDIPIKSLNLHFNVNFTIVSQVNPHINLFFFNSRGTVGRPVTHRKGRGWRGGFLGSAIEQYIKLDMNKWLRVLRHLELLPRPLGQDWSEIWLQKFSGTVTVWPKTIPSDFYYILSDPTPERLARMLLVGQQSTFPKIQFVNNRLKIETAITSGLREFAPAGAAIPVMSQGRQRGCPIDSFASRLDGSLAEEPEQADYYKDDQPTFASEVLDLSSMDQASSAPSSRNSSRPSIHRYSPGNLFQEMRRQSAVFFDDPDLYVDDDTRKVQ